MNGGVNMAFNKIDVKSIIEKERKNKEFDSEYEIGRASCRERV